MSECARACRLTTWCQSMSYRTRYSSSSSSQSQDIGNCLLSDIKPDQLRDVGDLVKVSGVNIVESMQRMFLNRTRHGTSTESALIQTVWTEMIPEPRVPSGLQVRVFIHISTFCWLHSLCSLVTMLLSHACKQMKFELSWYKMQILQINQYLYLIWS